MRSNLEIKRYLSCITHAAPATESTVVIQNEYARCWCCNVHYVLAYTRAVSQNLASSLDRQHFCASLNRSARAMSVNAPARVRCAKTRSARRLSALWDTAGEKCRAYDSKPCKSCQSWPLTWLWSRGERVESLCDVSWRSRVDLEERESLHQLESRALIPDREERGMRKSDVSREDEKWTAGKTLMEKWRSEEQRLAPPLRNQKTNIPFTVSALHSLNKQKFFSNGRLMYQDRVFLSVHQ